MKKQILKSIPVALALLALASCSNEDFLGNGALNGKKQLIVTVEDPTSGDNAMRAAFSWNDTKKNTNVLWQKGDVFRVYDEKNQLWDPFTCDGTAITYSAADEPQVEKYVNAIFPGDKVTYAGWNREDKVAYAVMKIESKPVFGGTEVVDGATYYMGNLPLWGETEEGTGNNLVVKLAHLAAYAEVTVYAGQEVQKVRAVAFKDESSYNSGKTTATESLTSSQLDLKTPLSGSFEAELKEGGALQANTNDLADGKSYIEVDLSKALNEAGEMKSETHIFIPVVPNTYACLAIQYYNGTTWVDFENAGVYKKAALPRNAHISDGLQVGTPAQGTKVWCIDDLNYLLRQNAEKVSAGQEINIDLYTDETLTTKTDKLVVDNTKGEDNKTYINSVIEIPEDLAENIIININGAIEASLANIDFKINNKSEKDVVINIKNGVSGVQDVVVECEGEGNVTLAGTWNCKQDNKPKQIKLNGETNVAFGNGATAPFSTEMTILAEAEYSGKITVDAGSGSVAGIEAADDGAEFSVEVLSGKVETIDKGADAEGDVEVKDGTVGEISTAAGAVTVSGGTVNTISTLANVTIVESEVQNVNMLKNASEATLTLTGGQGDNAKLAAVNTLTITKDAQKITVISKDKAALRTLVNNGAKALTIETSLSSGEDAAKLKVAAADVVNGKIYTAAQLAAIPSGACALNASTVTLTGAKWNTPNFSGTLSLAGATEITGLNAPLFGTISGTSVIGNASTIKDNAIETPRPTLTLKTVTISGAETADMGALAKVATGTTTVRNVTIDGLTLTAATGKKEAVNYGGLIGCATGEVNLTNIKLNGTSNAITAYANGGGYIGNFAGTKFTATVDDAKALQSQVTFTKTNTSTQDADKVLYGTFGNFIGSITTASGTVQVKFAATKVGNSTFGTDFDHYFTGTNGVVPSTLGFDNNTNSDKKYKGMVPNYEIGYSSAKATVQLSLYGEEDDWRQETLKSLNDINVFE